MCDLGAVVPEHGHAQTVADQNHINASLLLKVGDRVIVASQPGDRFTGGDFLEQCGDSYLFSLSYWMLRFYSDGGF